MNPRPTRTTVMRQPGELLPAEDSTAKMSVEDLSQRVQQAQDVLIDLERRREEIERQKRQLEELRRKQTEFEHGQHEIRERLTRGLVTLQRQEHELKREAEQVQIIREQFADQLQGIESIDPQDWDSAHLEENLTHALATVDQAQAVYSQSQVRLEALRRQTSSVEAPVSSIDQESADGEYAPSDFWTKVTTGFAYSLPGLIGLFLLTLLWLMKR